MPNTRTLGNLKEFMIERNTEEMDAILLLLRKYMVLPMNLIHRFMNPMDHISVDRLVNQLIRNQYIFADSSKEMIGIRRNFSITPLMEKQHSALEVVLLFRKHLRYHAPTEFPSTIYFLLDEYECEVIVITQGEEMLMNKLFSRQTNSEIKRFIFIETEEQIPLIRIPNIVWFCKRTKEGIIEKYVQENL